MFSDKEYFTAPTDMFALGVLLFIMLFGVPPLDNFNRASLTTRE